MDRRKAIMVNVFLNGGGYLYSPGQGWATQAFAFAFEDSFVFVKHVHAIIELAFKVEMVLRGKKYAKIPT